MPINKEEPSSGNKFRKLKAELLEKNNKRLDHPRPWDSKEFKKKMAELDEKTQLMRKMLAPERRPHQRLPPITPKYSSQEAPGEPQPLPDKAAKTKHVPQDLEEILQNFAKKTDPNFVDVSCLSLTVWAELSRMTNGQLVPVLMKSLRLEVWDKLAKYYGVLVRAGRIDRAVLYELGRDAIEGNANQSACRDLLRGLGDDLSEAKFQLGRIMMSVHHGIVAQSGPSNVGPSQTQETGKRGDGKTSLTLQVIQTKIDQGLKCLIKAKKQENDKH